jgi:hypothetical protein
MGTKVIVLMVLCITVEMKETDHGDIWQTIVWDQNEIEQDCFG